MLPPVQMDTSFKKPEPTFRQSDKMTTLPLQPNSQGGVFRLTPTLTSVQNSPQKTVSHCHSPHSSCGLSPTKCDAPCSSCASHQRQKPRRMRCNTGLISQLENEPIPYTARNVNQKRKEEEDQKFQVVRPRTPKLPIERSRFAMKTMFSVLTPEVPLRTAQATTHPIRKLRLSTQKHVRKRPKGTAYCRSKPAKPPNIRQWQLAPKPAAVWPKPPTPAQAQRDTKRTRSSLTQALRPPTATSAAKLQDQPQADAKETDPGGLTTRSRSSSANQSSPGPQRRRRLSATKSETSSACSEDTESTPASTTADSNLPTLESASTTSLSTSEVRGKFWDDASSCCTLRSETSDVVPVDYGCSAPPTTVAEDLDWLEQLEDHPVSLVNEQFFSSAVFMPVVDTEFKVTTLGYVCTGPCKDWSDWLDTLGQPGWCSHCKVPAHAAFSVLSHCHSRGFIQMIPS